MKYITPLININIVKIQNITFKSQPSALNNRSNGINLQRLLS